MTPAQKRMGYGGGTILLLQGEQKGAGCKWVEDWQSDGDRRGEGSRARSLGDHTFRGEGWKLTEK
jgi:hypothetical protein